MTRMETLMTKILASLCQIMNWRTVLGLALFAALSACTPAPQIASVTQSLRVNSINVIVPEKSRHGEINWTRGGVKRVFPPESIGLSKSKIRSDFSAVLRREIIPASKNGQRAVNVQIEIYNMYLKCAPIGTYGTPNINCPSMGTVMDVTDATTGESVISEEWIYISPYTVGKDAGDYYAVKKASRNRNYIRSYNTLLKLFPIEIRKRLLK